MQHYSSIHEADEAYFIHGGQKLDSSAHNWSFIRQVLPSLCCSAFLRFPQRVRTLYITKGDAWRSLFTWCPPARWTEMLLLVYKAGGLNEPQYRQTHSSLLRRNPHSAADEPGERRRDPQTSDPLGWERIRHQRGGTQCLPTVCLSGVYLLPSVGLVFTSYRL